MTNQMMNTTDPTTGPLGESLSILAVIAMRVTGADGFMYLRRSKTGGLVRSRGSGVDIREDALSGQGPQIATSFPLRRHGTVDGILAFAFSDHEKLDIAESPLKQLASMIERVWEAQSTSDTYREMLEGIITLETELVDSKIISRARGILKDEPDKETVDQIVRHVDSVLRPSRTFRTLRLILEELHSEATERHWTGRAKWLLQRVHGMSEEEAHAYLRTSSRESRKPLLDVARHIVERRCDTQKGESFDLPNQPS